MMFWAWFQWQVTTKPYSLEDDGDTFRMNDTTTYFWHSTPEQWWSIAISIDVMLGL